MWKILVADDKEPFHRLIEKLLLDLLPKNSFKLSFTSYAFTSRPGGSQTAHEILTKDDIHLAIIDCYFEDEQPYIVFGKQYNDTVLGEGLIRLHSQAQYPLRYIFVTAFTDSKYEVGTAFDKFMRESNGKIIALRKSFLEKDFKSKVPHIFRELARILISQNLSSNDKQQILKIIPVMNEESIIKIHSEDWKIGAVCAGWWGSDHKNFQIPLPNILKNLITPNLTLAASECFGIDGVKQATHPLEQGYYNGQEGWYQKALTQVNVLKNVLGDVVSLKNDSESDIKFPLSKLNQYLNNLNEFEKTLLDTDKNSDTPIKNLQKFVCENFRFGISPKSTKINYPKNSVSGHNFEIYMPIHSIYEKEFQMLESKCNQVSLASFQTEESHNRVVKTWNEKKEPTLHHEYIIFEQEGNDDYAANIPQKILPDYFEVFQSKNFNVFGEMYLVIRRNGKPKLFDCTFTPCIEKDLNILNIGLDEEDKGLKEYILGKMEKVKAFFIFKFYCWRQP